jgi:hypothetical protein
MARLVTIAIEVYSSISMRSQKYLPLLLSYALMLVYINATVSLPQAESNQ